MTDKENITAILECYFSGFKKEIIDSACNRILELKHHINVDVLVPKKQELSHAIFDKGYKDGLNDAWECAKKIVGSDYRKEMNEIFDDDYYYDRYGLFTKYSAAKVVSKIKEYEEKQKQACNDIKVGDEVMDGEVFNSGKGIVTFASPAVIYVLWYDGSTGRRKLEDIKKTGRHFDQITEVLEWLKEENK